MNARELRARSGRIVVGFVVLCVSVVGLVPVAAGEAVGDLASCSARTGKLSVVVLVDESESLRRTDPDNQRVSGVQAALQGLAGAADRAAGTENPITIDVLMLGFGVGTTPLGEWTPLDGGTLPGLVDEAANLASRNDGLDTDYAAAMLGAQAELARRTGESDEQSPCTAILWFTDGEYDIEARNTGEKKPYAPDISLNGAAAAEALEVEGRRQLCEPGGIVDSLRSNGTKVFAIALSPEISAEDQDFLSAVAEGQAGDTTCGAPLPADAPPPGAYLGTDEVSQLVSQFFDLVNAVAGGTRLPESEPLEVCDGSACASGTKTFIVDPGILSFNLLAVASAPGIEVELSSSELDSEPIRLTADDPSGTAELGSADTRWTWVAADSVLADVTLPDADGPSHGEWSVTFIDRTGESANAVADASIYVFGDIEPYLEPVAFRAGEEISFDVGVRHREGTPVNEDLFREVEVEAAVIDPGDGLREPIELSAPDGDGLRRGAWEAPAPAFPSVVNVSVTASVVTESGQALAPATRTFPIEVLPPASYPSITPTDLQLGTITGTDPVEGEITVTGGESSAGCVWLESSNVELAPEDAGAVAVSVEPDAGDADSCLRVAAGETKTLRVIVSPESSANGTTSGALGLSLTSETNPDVLRIDIPWRAGLQKPLDPTKKFWVFVGLMAFGLIVPFVLMWLVNWFTAKFDDPGELRVARLKVKVTANGDVWRIDQPRAGLAVEPSDFTGIDGGSKRREFEVLEVLFRSHVSVWPLKAPTGKARRPGFAVGSFAPPATGRAIGAAPVPFGLAGTGVVLVPLEVLDRALQPESATLSLSKPAGPSGVRALPDDVPAPSLTDRPRPDLDIEVWVFARALDLGRYTTHFDSHRSAVAAVITTLWRMRGEELGARSVIAPETSSPDSSSPEPVGSDWDPPPVTPRGGPRVGGDAPWSPDAGEPSSARRRRRGGRKRQSDDQPPTQPDDPMGPAPGRHS